MNPCNTLEDNCHLAVFFIVTHKSLNNLLVLFKGTSASIIELATFKNAFSPSGPKLVKLFLTLSISKSAFFKL
jgi:hypothetical protein